MEFSIDGKYLLSAGCENSDFLFYLEIFDVDNFYSVGFICVGNSPIFDLKFFSINSSNFLTIGYRNISLFKIKGKEIKKYINIY